MLELDAMHGEELNRVRDKKVRPVTTRRLQCRHHADAAADDGLMLRTACCVDCNYLCRTVTLGPRSSSTTNVCARTACLCCVGMQLSESMHVTLKLARSGGDNSDLAFTALCSPLMQAPGGNMTKFLNRLLGAHVNMQSRIFSLFCALLVRLADRDVSSVPLCGTALCDACAIYVKWLCDDWL